MAGKAILCAQCKAPLRGGVGSVTCEYCGAANMVGNPPPSKTMMRGVVHDVLNEDLNRNGIPDALERRVAPPMNRSAAAPAAAFKSGHIVAIALLIGITALGGIVSFLITRGPVAESPSSAPTAERVMSPPPPINPIPLPESAELHSLAFDGSGHVFAALGNTLLRADTVTLKLDWNQPIQATAYGSQHVIMLLPERIAVASAGMLTFYSIVDGALTGSYKIANAGFPYFCSVDNIVVVTELGSKTVRVDALTARKSETKVSCKASRDLDCQKKAEVCSWRRRTFADHTCYLNLRSGDQDFVPCDTDNGTGDKALVAFNRKSKILWSSKLHGGSRPTYMTVVGDIVLVHNRNLLEAFDRTTGAPRWQKVTAGDALAVTPDGSRILAGNGQTLVAVDPTDGHEIAKLGPWLPAAKTPAAP